MLPFYPTRVRACGAHAGNPAYPATSKLRTHVTLAARPAAERAGSEGAGLAARGTCVRRLAHCPGRGLDTSNTSTPPPPPPCGFSTQQTGGGGESSGKRKFCYKVATQREPGGCRQKIQKKFQKNSKKIEKMKKWSQRTEGDFDNFVVKKKSAKNPLSTPQESVTSRKKSCQNH